MFGQTYYVSFFWRWFYSASIYLKDISSILITVLKIYVKPSAKRFDTEAAQTYELPEQCQELRPKHVPLIIN